ncbi:MAG: hypothetical protein QXR53_05040 [Candidatus Norongarragalinales archaeon]
MAKKRLVRGAQNLVDLIDDVYTLSERYPKANAKNTRVKIDVFSESRGKIISEHEFSLDYIYKNRYTFYEKEVRKEFRKAERDFFNENFRNPTSGFLTVANATLEKIEFKYKRGAVIETPAYKLAKELISELRFETKFVKSQLAILGREFGKLSLQRYNAKRRGDTKEMQRIDFQRLDIEQKRMALRSRLNQIKEGIKSYQTEARAERAVALKSAYILVRVNAMPLDSPENGKNVNELPKEAQKTEKPKAKTKKPRTQK